ncbi:MAG: matrixin family metalloprotease [Dehalococcoidia bacterium]|nr:matrixin family metalloprotease [Dehalococcoidia bacterium]
MTTTAESESRALGDEDDAPVNAQWGSWGWSWEAEELPVAVAYNPAGALNGFTEGDLVAALETWSNVEGSSFAFEYAGQTDRDASMNTDGEDGANVVAWQDLGCDGGCVLGLTTKSFGQHEVDISLNTNPGARLDDGTYDISTVLIHELGHMAGLEHSCPALGPCTDAEAEAVMFYSYSGVRRELTSDDVEGLVETYPGGTTSSIPIDDGAVARPVEEDEGEEEQPAVEVTLQSGWNLQTLPSGVIDDAVAELPCVEAVYAYDHGSGWSHWVRGLDSSLQTLNQATSSDAYWFLASSSCSAVLASLQTCLQNRCCSRCLQGAVATRSGLVRAALASTAGDR